MSNLPYQITNEQPGLKQTNRSLQKVINCHSPKLNPALETKAYVQMPDALAKEDLVFLSREQRVFMQLLRL